MVFIVLSSVSVTRLADAPGGRAYDAIRMSAPPAAADLASPCVRNCCLDDDNVCMGCGRSLEEIVSWGTASDADKRAILARSRARREARRKARNA
jgi:predicted Fe-S protein YdhL (DUF1289 family)